MIAIKDVRLKSTYNGPPIAEFQRRLVAATIHTLHQSMRFTNVMGASIVNASGNTGTTKPKELAIEIVAVVTRFTEYHFPEFEVEFESDNLPA